MLRLSLLVTVIYVFASCNNSQNDAPATTTDTATSETTVAVKDSTEFDYDAALEPLTVGAKYSKELADTLGVRLYEFTMKPGDSAALHKHPDHVVYVLQGGVAELSFNGGPAQKMELKTGMGFVSGQMTDAGKNVGKTTIKLVVADIYRPRK